ncbi:hypothetical protein WH7805_09194 [Synechococcus sp. WH 7805]|nr:hypothetical protein WH7805_09194 [Synechococcus sp. WH 7805]
MGDVSWCWSVNLNAAWLRLQRSIIDSKTFQEDVDLVLHIGTEKTGTTSIQEFLKKNMVRLRKNGVYIPQSPMVGYGNHRWIPLIANNDDFSDDFAIIQEFKSLEDRKERINKKRNELIDECRNAAASCKTLIFTSEHFQSRLRGIEEIQRLKKLVEELASSIRILIYIRDPLQTAVSLLSTAIKGGGTLVGLPSPQQQSIEYLCNHAQTIRRWHECFPDAEIIVRRFERSFLEKGDVVIDFCSQVIDEFSENEYELLNRSNETLSLSGMALLRKLNLEYPKFVDNKSNQMRGQISRFIMNNTNDGSRFLPCRDEFEAYQSHFHESCEIVRSQYFPLNQSLFDDQKEFAEKKINLTEVQLDPRLLEKLIISLWGDKRKLQLKLRNAK